MALYVRTSTLVQRILRVSTVLKPCKIHPRIYASTIWSLHHKNHIQLIEPVQRRTTRLAVNCYSRYQLQSVTDIFKQLDWPTLNKRRNQIKFIMMYKIIHGLVFIQHSLPLTYSNLNNISRGHKHRFIQPATRVDSYKHSFFPSTIHMWNSLPHQVVSSESLLQFKNSLCNNLYLHTHFWVLYNNN